MIPWADLVCQKYKQPGGEWWRRTAAESELIAGCSIGGAARLPAN